MRSCSPNTISINDVINTGNRPLKSLVFTVKSVESSIDKATVIKSL